jgi:signal transduction histidine kinase/CheY-like chemotaxis protein
MSQNQRSMTKYIVARANMLLFGVMVAILVLVGGVSWERFNATRMALNMSKHSSDVVTVIRDLRLEVRNAETGQRGYVLTGDEDYLVPYNDAVTRIGGLQGDLQRLTADNASQQTRLRELAPVLQRKLEELAQTIQLRKSVGFDAALQVVRTDIGRTFMKDIEVVLDAMTADETDLLDQRMHVADSRGMVVQWLVALGAVIAIVTLLWAAKLLNNAWARSYEAETEQRTLALRLRASLDSLSQGVAVFSSDWLLTNWNECFQVLLDLPKGMLHSGAPYLNFQAEVLLDGVPLLESESQIRHGRQVVGQPVTFERKNASGHQLEIRRTTMPTGGFVLTVTDMTKRAEAESVLREAQKMQAIGQLTGGIAHDFNNLLTVILGNLEFIHGKMEGDAVLGKRVERAVWAAQRGATLTAQLLAFARKQPLAPKPIDLKASLPDIVPLLQRTLGEHIDIRYVEAAGLWLAMADAAQLESAVLNLALNARDAMPGGGRLTIEMTNKVIDEDYAQRHAEVTPGEYVMVAVSDTGHGMTPDVLARVFEPFYTTKPDGKGTGLGLAMVFGFIKQSGGHVKVYSEPNEGTTVRLYLPRARDSLPVDLQRSSAPLDLPRGTATVLVVEDEPAVREIAVAILTDLGYRVLEAGDGEEGQRVFGLHAASIDLLLTDVVLPGKIRGRELAERITAMRPDVRVLFMSGYTENSIVHHGRLDEGVQLLGKPFKREQLARKVADALGRSATSFQSTEDNVVLLQAKREP